MFSGSLRAQYCNVVRYSTAEFSQSSVAVGYHTEPAHVNQYVSKWDRPRPRVYAWGLAASGAIGIKEFVQPTKFDAPLKHVYAPCRIPLQFESNIRHAAAGFGFTVLVIKGKGDGQLVGFGLNTSSQLGFIPLRSSPDESKQWIISPHRISLPFTYPDETMATDVACGRAHTVIVTDKEGVFTLGNNAFGQCGRAIIEDEIYENNAIINNVKPFWDHDDCIRKVICGLDHTLVLTENGKLYACGSNTDGQLASGDYKNRGKFCEVTGDTRGEKIERVSSSGDTCLAVSDKGEIFGWGNSEYGQLACVSDGDVQVGVARRLPFKFDGLVVDVAASGSACIILSDTGSVYVWGFGILGVGPNTELLRSPQKLPEPLFGRNEISPEKTVAKVFAGLMHFGAVTTDGELFMWGKNRYGVLGLGNNKDQYFPFKVSIGMHVKDLCCAPDHTVALCKTPF